MVRCRSRSLSARASASAEPPPPLGGAPSLSLCSLPRELKLPARAGGSVQPPLAPPAPRPDLEPVRRIAGPDWSSNDATLDWRRESPGRGALKAGAPLEIVRPVAPPGGSVESAAASVDITPPPIRDLFLAAASARCFSNIACRDSTPLGINPALPTAELCEGGSGSSDGNRSWPALCEEDDPV